MEWNNKELRELVYPQLNEEKYAQFETSMASVQWKLNIALRSRDKCLSSLKSHSNYTQLELAQAAMKVLLGGASDSEACIIDTMLSDSELYLISFAHAMHSIPDILSNVAYHALELDIYSDCPRNISLWELKKFIQKKDLYPYLLAAILELEVCFEWIYLNAFTNVTKHQKVIGLTSSVKLIDWENGILNVTLKSFNRNSSISFLPARLNVFLESDYETLGARYLKIGQAINREAKS